MSGLLFGLVDERQLVLFTAYLLIGLGVFVVSRFLLQEQESLAAQERLDSKGERRTANFLVKITRPIFMQYVVPIIRGKPFWEGRRKHYKRKLVSAGLVEEFTPDEFIAFKLLLIVFFPLVGGLLDAGGLVDVAWYIIVGSAAVGWFWPDFWIRGRIQARQKIILKSMPFIVDLLALSTEAGLDFIGAMGKVVEKANPSPLVDEFAQLLKEIKVGASRQEAMREMALRVDMSQVSSFVSILISADQMGASIGKVLRQQSDSIRGERMLRAEKAGAAAASKVILPVILFIVPAVFLMIFGPFIIRFLQGGGTGF